MIDYFNIFFYLDFGYSVLGGELEPLLVDLRQRSMTHCMMPKKNLNFIMKIKLEIRGKIEKNLLKCLVKKFLLTSIMER